MKILENFLLSCALSAIGVLLAHFIITPLLFPTEPITTYECPCELSQLETDVVRHTNKDGIETVTTYIEIKDCIQSNNN